MLLKYIPFYKRKQEFNSSISCTRDPKNKSRNITRRSRLTSSSVSFEETIATIGCESDNISRQILTSIGIISNFSKIRSLLENPSLAQATALSPSCSGRNISIACR